MSSLRQSEGETSCPSDCLKLMRMPDKPGQNPNHGTIADTLE